MGEESTGLQDLHTPGIVEDLALKTSSPLEIWEELYIFTLFLLLIFYLDVSLPWMQCDVNLVPSEFPLVFGRVLHVSSCFPSNLPPIMKSGHTLGFALYHRVSGLVTFSDSVARVRRPLDIAFQDYADHVSGRYHHLEMDCQWHLLLCFDICGSVPSLLSQVLRRQDFGGTYVEPN